MKLILATLRLLLHPESVQTLVAVGALCGLAYGVWQIHKPSAWIVVSGILLAGVVYARTRTPIQ